MEVFVQLRGKARKETGRGELKISLSGATPIFELFDALEKQLHWPFKERFIDSDTGDLQRKVIVLVNGFPVRGKLSSTPLRDGDKIILFPHTVCG